MAERTCEDHQDYYNNANFTGDFYTAKTVYDKNGNIVERNGDVLSYTDNLITVKGVAIDYQITLSAGLATKIAHDENNYKEIIYDSDGRISVIKDHFYTDVISYSLTYQNGNLTAITRKIESNGIQEQYIIKYLSDTKNALLTDQTDVIYVILNDFIPQKNLGKLSLNAVSKITNTYKSSGALSEDYTDFTYSNNGDKIKVSEVHTGADNALNPSGPIVPNPNKSTATYYELSKICP
ncbi:hypothetical protein GCM10007352_33500 [Mucilaginibacter phyllosphaerae]|nr:hypothetical protein GCM10007352_33500 [Mucilaginibacter phyllosphaerae]